MTTGFWNSEKWKDGAPMEEIISYLRKTYKPLAILLYGSWQDGTQDDMSDFDCMVIVAEKEKNTA